MGEEQPVDAENVTSGFTVTARPDVTEVEVDGEIVLYDDRAKVMHRLSPTAAQVWRCLDGSGTLAEVAADLADVYQVDPGQVLTDVVSTARQFGSAGLLVEVGDRTKTEDSAVSSDPTEGEDAPGPFIPEISTSCMDSSFPLGEAGSLTVKAGPYLLGVRLSTHELVEMARAVLAPSLVEGVVAPPNVSVKMTLAEAGRPLLYCYRSTLLVTRARSPKRALEAAISLLSSCVPSGTSGIRLPALAAVRSGQVALFCPESRMVASRLVPRLRAAGWDALDPPAVDLDPEGCVVIPSFAMPLDSTALAGLPASPFDGTRPVPGRYPVAAWVAVAGTDPMPESMAGRVAHVAAGVSLSDIQRARPVFETTAAMLQRAAWVVSPTVEANDFAAALSRAVP